MSNVVRQQGLNEVKTEPVVRQQDWSKATIEPVVRQISTYSSYICTDAKKTALFY
ncbi:hypothetical protein [Nonlabens marinus]|uniref:hypothetical protein n=1 Tax=Nonlabens marinus TaxID=930802 RepID=UPI00130D7E6D|nr:hypothetical protein [Nonlabens marinus]